ncbi:DUF3347 domain-containing protein [Pedobacter metabolipauper]|nr:DUF3347 domain-containing protein [Pedobacter metabolipauper]
MKSLISLGLILLLSVTTLSVVNAQKVTTPSLQSYLLVKDALVNSDAKLAAERSAELGKSIQTFKTVSLTADGKKVFDALKEKLVADAGLIAKSDNISDQRSRFETLSANMILLAKAAKLSDQEIYLQYCPMKKASWLSSEKDIKNPYYGKQMLTCGSVKETL